MYEGGNSSGLLVRLSPDKLFSKPEEDKSSVTRDASNRYTQYSTYSRYSLYNVKRAILPNTSKSSGILLLDW